MDTRSYEERVARDKTKVEAASRPRAGVFHVYRRRGTA